MYPKVKVRVQRDEAERYAFEKNSLESLKAFEWLSLNHSSSSDDSPVSVARVPRSYVPMSPPPTFRTSKDQTQKKAAEVENQKSGRASSAPRPRAVLSSPNNDVIIGRKKPVQREPLSGVENKGRHTQCKIFPKSAAVESFSLARGYNKESMEPRSSTIRAKSRPTLADSSKRSSDQKKFAPSPSRG